MTRVGIFGPAITVSHFTFYIHSGTEACQVFRLVVGCKFNAYGDALLHLDEVAGGIILRHQGQGRAGGIRDGRNHTRELHARYGIHLNVDFLSVLHDGGLRFLVVGDDPLLCFVNQGHHGLSRLYQLSFMDVLAAGHSVGRGHDDGVRQVQLSQVQFGSRHFDGRVILLQTLGLFMFHQGGGLLLSGHLLVACLGCFVFRLHPVVLLDGDGIFLDHRRVSFVVGFRIFQADGCFLDTGISH